MSKIIQSLVIWIVLGILALLGGSLPGIIRIHHSGDATYITHDRCFVSANVERKHWDELQTWCTANYERDHQ